MGGALRITWLKPERSISIPQGAVPPTPSVVSFLHDNCFRDSRESRPIGQYILRRVLMAIPTLIVISFVIFAVLELAPGDPTGALPESIPTEPSLFPHYQ